MTGKKQSLILKSFSIITLIAGAIFAILQTVAIQSFYDESVFLYKSGAVLPTVLSVMLAVYALITLILTLVMKNNSLPTKVQSDRLPEKVLSAIICVSFAFFSVIAIKNVLAIKEATTTLDRSQICLIIAAILGFFTAVYFILRALGNKSNKLRATLGLCAVAFCVLRLLSLYFGRTTHINDPRVVMEEFSLIAFMVYILVETRYELNIGKANFYLGFGSLSCVFLAVWSVSDIVYRFTTVTLFEQEGFLAIGEFLLAVLVAIRMIRFIKSDNA